MVAAARAFVRSRDEHGLPADVLAGRPKLQTVKRSLSFCGFLRFWVVFLRFPAGFPTPWPYFRVCVSVAVFLSTETSLYTVH